MNRKRYTKATLYYEKGELDKALKECEIGISENLKDSALLNLKGIILYQKGLLNEAIISWNINREYNDDDMAKSYIKDAKSDEERERLYLKGEGLLKKLKVEEALKIFEKCKESDFNGIKVNTAIAMCYFKKGMFDESRYYVLNALKIDKNFSSAKNLLKELEEMSGVGNTKHKNILIATLLIAVFCGGVYYLADNFIYTSSKSNALTSLEKDEPTKNEDIVEEKPQEKIDFSTLEKEINNENVDKLYDLLKNVDKNNLSKEEVSKINKAEEILQRKGVETFYKNMQGYLKDNNYDDALSEVSKAYDYGKNHYLYPHIIYFTAHISQKLTQNDDAIKYYEEYIKLYDKEGYTEEVLYNLVVLNKDNDIEKSKKYAEKLVKNYPKSMYNNNVVKGIINGE